MNNLDFSPTNHIAVQVPGLVQDIKILFLNCRTYTKVYDPEAKALSCSMRLLFANFQPDMVILAETHLQNLGVAKNITAVCGYERHFAALGSPSGRPHGILVMWSQPFRVSERPSHGHDWIRLKCGHGLSIAAVYTAPGEGGEHFRELIPGWASEGSRLLVIGDLNMKYNRRELLPWLVGAGLAQVASTPTTRGSRVDREPTDVAFVTIPYNRMITAFPLLWDSFSPLSDYHWPVIFRIPKNGVIHPSPPSASWRSRMVMKLARADHLQRGTVREAMILAIEAAPPPQAPMRIFGTPGSLARLFYKSPKKYAVLIRGGGDFTASAADMPQEDRLVILRRTQEKFSRNPSRFDYNDFVKAHIDPFYPAVSPWSADDRLMGIISNEELMEAYGDLRDAATTDFSVQALGEVIERYRELLRAEYNSWMINGRCMDTWHIQVCYVLISKKGKISVDHHRVIGLERATGKLFFKVLEKRLRAVLDETDILGSNHLAFCTERSHVEILVGLRSVMDATSKGEQMFLATHDWPNAYDYMSWGLLPVIGGRLLGASRFFAMISSLFRDAPRGLYAGHGDLIGAIEGATNGGVQGNCILPLVWNLYCAPLVRALTASYANVLAGATFGFCDDAVGVRLSLASVERFFDICDDYVTATGSPMGTKHAVAGNAEALDRLQAVGAFARRARGAAVPIVGAIHYLGQCAHLDKRSPCATRSCTTCYGRAMASVCDACIEMSLQNLKVSSLSPMNRAEMSRVYILSPLAQQVWLCKGAWERYMSWETGSPARPGRAATSGVRQAIHNHIVSGPYNEAIELSVKTGGAGLGNHTEFLARQIIADFIRSAFGPSSAARVINRLWMNPQRGGRNRVVEKALKVLDAKLELRQYPSPQLLAFWKAAYAGAPMLSGKTPMVTWASKVDDESFVVGVEELNILNVRGVQGALSELVFTRDIDEAQLMAIWVAMRLGKSEDMYFIVTSPTAAIRVKKFRATGHRKRLKLAYGLWLHQMAQTTMDIVSYEDIGMSPERYSGLEAPNVQSAAGPHPSFMVALSSPEMGVRYDRFTKFMRQACGRRELDRLWTRLGASKSGVDVRVPRTAGMSIKLIAWEQSARVGVTKQCNMVWTSPLSAQATHMLMGWRFGGILKSGLLPTTRCRACGLRPYTAAHVVALPEYCVRVGEAIRKYGPTLERWGCPRWWEPGEWLIPGHGLMCALGYVPKEVQIEIEACGMNKAQRIFREEGVLDMQLEFVKAFLEVSEEHAPEDARVEVGERAPRRAAVRLPGIDNCVFVERRSKRLLRKPDISEAVEKYRILERLLVMFDGAARRNVSASSVVIYDTRSSFFIRFAYQHPRYRLAAVGERIGYILGYLLLRRVAHLFDLKARRSVAYVGDNETLMRQVSRDPAVQYRCTSKVARSVCMWLRNRIPEEDGNYFVHREYNWMSDQVGNEVLDGKLGVLASTEVGTKDYLWSVVGECEEVWAGLQQGQFLQPLDRWEGGDSSDTSDVDESSDSSVMDDCGDI